MNRGELCVFAFGFQWKMSITVAVGCMFAFFSGLNNGNSYSFFFFFWPYSFFIHILVISMNSEMQRINRLTRVIDVSQNVLHEWQVRIRKKKLPQNKKKRGSDWAISSAYTVKWNNRSIKISKAGNMNQHTTYSTAIEQLTDCSIWPGVCDYD